MTLRFATAAFAATLLLGAFSVSAEEADPEAPAPATSTADATSALDPMAFVRGAQKWGNTCARCHAMRDAKDLDDAEWQVVVTHMRARAGLTATDSAEILRFLQQSN
ncbi:MAG: hypothetical protein WC809_00110 [Sinimarinibacterium sp.]|jgi:cytochrome c5